MVATPLSVTHVTVFEREEVDQTDQCPLCNSRQTRQHFDPSLDPDGDYFTSCASVFAIDSGGIEQAELTELRRYFTRHGIRHENLSSMIMNGVWVIMIRFYWKGPALKEDFDP